LPTRLQHQVCKRSNQILRALLILVLLLQLFGCATKELTTAERGEISDGEKALVLIRINFELDERTLPPFKGGVIGHETNPYVFALGTFETIGEPSFSFYPPLYRFLSKESGDAGWAYFVLSPGIYYLAVLGPNQYLLLMPASARSFLEDAPRWKLDVPLNTKFLYAGTLNIKARRVNPPGRMTVYGGNCIEFNDSEDWKLVDEYALATKLLSEHFPNEREIEKNLIQRWHKGDPIIIRTPTQKRNQ